MIKALNKKAITGDGFLNVIFGKLTYYFIGVPKLPL
tara:strand:+ start:1688 stop:1795 length:108 start_codon:yes stop_codon:yes gene_type:complete